MRLLIVLLLSVSSTVAHAAVVASANLTINNLLATFSGTPADGSVPTIGNLIAGFDGATNTKTNSGTYDTLQSSKSSSVANTLFARSGNVLGPTGINGTTQASINSGPADEFSGIASSNLKTTGQFTLDTSQTLTVSFSANWDRSSSDRSVATAETLFSISLLEVDGSGTNLFSSFDAFVQDEISSSRNESGLPEFNDTINLDPGTYSFTIDQISRINLAAVPEPASVVGLGAILLGAAAVRRRKRVPA